MANGHNAVDWFVELLEFGDWQLSAYIEAIQVAGLEADARVNWLLHHVVNARRIWYNRVVTDGVKQPLLDNCSVEEIRSESVATTALWKSWLLTQADDVLKQIVHYADLQGNSQQQDVQRILMHIVNHNTHHLSEITRILRSHDVVPPRTDYIVFARTH
ncbi:MAG: DinB family protein [Bradyrhizobiaceae bacterium]|nr:DinB family protein [Bradyrhizobiaceae bacterium]